MFLKVKSRKRSLSLGYCIKLVARFCIPFEILSRIEPMDYERALPPSVKAHNVFHVSLLKKYVHEYNHVP